MALVLKVRDHHAYVVDEESDFCIANLAPRYELVYDGHALGVIDYVEDAIPLLEKHLKANPPRGSGSRLAADTTRRPGMAS
jgi:hypothetical protein